jgi:hypothetical protein
MSSHQLFYLHEHSTDVSNEVLQLCDILREGCDFSSQTGVRTADNYRRVPACLLSDGFCGQLKSARKFVNGPFPGNNVSHRRLHSEKYLTFGMKRFFRHPRLLDFPSLSYDGSLLPV